MKRNMLFMLAFLTLMAILTACGSGSASPKAAVSPTENAASAGSLINEAAANSGTDSGDLTIPLDSLSAQPSFIDWEQDGTSMQLIALLDGDQVRLAYNTCQSCAGSPYAYFVYKDGLLICQNCGNQFGLYSVGAVVGGCNPLPVGEASVGDDSVVIPASELKANAPAFINWKKFS